MNSNEIQSKVNKVDATQEKITAQNSNNQSNKLFGTFNEAELAYIVDNAYKYESDGNGGIQFIKPNFVINYLKKAERILDRARMSDDDKNFIKGAVQLLTSLGEYKEREEYDEFIAQNEWPEDIKQMLENGDEDIEDIKDTLFEELQFAAGDAINMMEYNSDGFYDDVLESYIDAAEEYYLIAQEYNIELDDYTQRIYDTAYNKYYYEG